MSTEIDGVNGIIKNTTSDGDVTIKGNDGGSEISALILDMSDAGTATFNHDVKLGDNSKAMFGNGNDLQIFHDGSNSIISDANTGSLELQSNGAGVFIYKGNATEQIARFLTDAAVELFYDNVKKFETTATGIEVTGRGTFTNTDQTDTLTLSNTDADENVGPRLKFGRNSASPADGDLTGDIRFEGKNDAGQDVIAGQIKTVIGDVRDGNEYGEINFNAMVNGTLTEFMALASNASPAVVFNEQSADIDFRVESNNYTHCLVVDGGNDRVGIGNYGQAPEAPLDVRDAQNNIILRVQNTATSGNVYGQQIQFSSTVNDTGNYFFRCLGNNNSTVRAAIYSNGDFDSATNSYGATSDERIKQNITDANSQWNDIKGLKVRNFKFKDEVRTEAGGGQAAKTYLGLVAQEAETVSPGLIKLKDPETSDIISSSEFGTLYTEPQDEVLYTADDQEVIDGDKNVGKVKTPKKAIGDVKEVTEQVKSVSYSVLYMKAIKALQEAQTRIETLETKVAALEG